jgi:hypothetical protein
MKKFPPGKVLSDVSTSVWSDYNPLKNQNTVYPRSISFEDIDKAVYGWFNTRDIIINKEKTPVVYLTPEKWGEFKQSWKIMDDDRAISFPYITIRRSQSPRLSTNPVKSRIPGKTFTTHRIPHHTNSGPTYKLYRVPQPIKVEMEYEIRALTHYISDANKINESLLRHFASIQAYLDIDNHFMPMTIENISDESNYDEMNEEKLIHTMYSIVVNGYIIDESEFEEKLGVSNILVNIEEQD